MHALSLMLVAVITGCASFSTGFGGNVALNGAPNRETSGHIEGGTFFHIKDKFIVEPRVASLAAPLKNSAYVVAYGGRISTRPKGDQPGLFVAGLYGTQLGKYDRPEGVDGSVFRASAGAIWTNHVKNKTVPAFTNLLVSMSAGLTYYHHQQDDIGAGDFLGAEISFTFGLNVPLALWIALRDWKPSKD